LTLVIVIIMITHHTNLHAKIHAMNQLYYRIYTVWVRYVNFLYLLYILYIYWLIGV